MLENKTIVIGVTGGIAAYKTCDVISKLRKRGASVYVIMTKAASQFVAPLTFQTLSNHFVISDMFAEPKTWEIEHISLAKKADLLVIVPATADSIGKIASGIADDMLSTTVMACCSPVLIAPAMNTGMYRNPIVQANILKLKELRYLFVEPVCGTLACGDVGAGKLADVDTIVDRIEEILLEPNPSEHTAEVSVSARAPQPCGTVQDLRGKKILVTAGPTREPLDPIRYITNRSSGKMGYALAAQAVKRGAAVTLVSGPVHLEVPSGISRLIRVETAQQMYQAVTAAFADQDIIIQSAAVADYKPAEYSTVKIKKTDSDLSITLERNPDIAYELGKIKGNKILVGFAAETDDVLAHAMKKIKKKNLDFIVANDVTQQGAGCGSDTNIITIIDAHGRVQEYPQLPKPDVADRILDAVAALLKSFY